VSNQGVLEALASLLGQALGPFAERLEGDQAQATLEQLGLRLPDSIFGAGVSDKIAAAATACSQLPQGVADLVTAVEAGDTGPIIEKAVALGVLVVRAGAAFGELGTTLDGAIQAHGGLTAQQKARLGAIAQKLPERFLHLALIAYVEDRQPKVKGALEIAGLFDDVAQPADPADPSAPPFFEKQVRFDRLGTMLSNPLQHLKDVYGFGNPGFDGLDLLKRVKALVDQQDSISMLIDVPGQPAALEAYLFRIGVVPGPLPSLSTRVRVPAEKDLGFAVPIAGPWSVTVDSKARFEGGVEFLLHPTDGLSIAPPTATVSLDMKFGLKAENADGSPIVLIGRPEGNRLAIQRFKAGVPFLLTANSGSPSPKLDIGASIEIEGGKVVIDGSQVDGFLKAIIGGINVQSDFAIGAFYDTRDGLRFTGSATIEIAIPAHLSLGPFEIPTIYLMGGVKADPGGSGVAIPVEFSCDIGAHLGPLAAAVSRLGAIADITFPKGGGNAGVAQVDIAFKPPNGVGLSLNVAVIQGGGYLYIDVDKGEYAGALELVIAGFLTVKAIGLITTRMPDGSDGFSLLIILSAEFGTPFQLGFGFTLNAVGGLVGVNRTMELERLAEGVRTGAVESVMFPHDVIANAPRIISDLRQFFPPMADTFLVGPMLKVGWGTPTLASLSIGVILEIPPGNIAILGVLQVVLPDEDAALVIIKVKFIGALEVDKQRLWFFASMFESRIVFLTIDGEMGLLVAWGDDSNFVLSVGGFHPSFSPPPLPFPSPHRIAVSLIDTDYARVRIEGYFAVTSNTVQFGAAVEVFFGVDDFNIQGHIQFDALFQFSPFYFIITFSASFSVTVFGVGLFSIGFRGELKGTSPWHVEGEGSISLLFFDISVPFSTTWGEDEDTLLPSIQIIPKLLDELNKDENWRAELPPLSNLRVSLRQIASDEGLLLHPVGVLKVSQRALPLNLSLDKVGAQRPTDAKILSVELADGELAKIADATESFATAQFKDMSDSAKLSAPAYEKQPSGLAISVKGTQVRIGQPVLRVVRYEEITIDSYFKSRARRIVGILFPFFAKLLFNNAFAQSKNSLATYRTKVPFETKVVVAEELFAVASSIDNSPVAGPDSYVSRAQAEDQLAAHRAASPRTSSDLHVVPVSELRMAA
jgi:hypothetical protein